MTVGVIDTQHLTDIASAIRSKSGSSDTFKPSEMAQGILDIPSGGITPTGTVNITSNGTHDVTNYASANVNVPSVSPSLGTKAITENGTYTASDDSLDGYSSVTVNVGGASLDLQMELIGTWTGELAEYTSTTEEVNNTFISITANEKYLYLVATIECDGELDTSNAKNWGGLTVCMGARYTSTNTGRYFNSANIMYLGVNKAILWTDVTSAVTNPVSTNSYGVYARNTASAFTFGRKAHATNCPTIMGGNYTVKVYGISAL